MGPKEGMTPLDQVQLVDEGARGRLRQLNVTTVEELLGQLQADPEALAKALGLTPDETEHLREQALDLVSPEVREALQQPGPEYPLGALDPGSR
jgi:hypothetical protein